MSTSPFHAAVDELVMSQVREGRKRRAFLLAALEDSFSRREVDAALRRLSKAGRIMIRPWPDVNDVLVGLPHHWGRRP